MSTNCYQIAYENAIDEIAAINAQTWRLTSRKEQLEKLLESLKPLVSESGFAAILARDAEDLQTESPAAEADAQASPVAVLLDVSQPEYEPLEAPASTMQPQAEETNAGASRSSAAISHDDVAALAYRFWNERGQTHGHHEEDWFRAARELQNPAY